jgi:hypothetical protein
MSDSRPMKRLQGAPAEQRGAPRTEPSDDDGLPDPERRSVLVVGAGVVLVILGIPMLALPGPGLLTIAAGAGLVAVGLGRRKGASDEPGEAESPE